jgi:hypothetical protein
MLDYWKTRDGQEKHEEVYQGSSTYMMQQVGGLRYCNMQQRACRVKIMLNWGVHGRRMKLMGLDHSGQCPIYMEADLLAHIAFNCHYSAANHKRQTWITGVQNMIQHSRRQHQHRTWRVDSATEKCISNYRTCTRDIRTNSSYGEDYGQPFSAPTSVIVSISPQRAYTRHRTNIGNFFPERYSYLENCPLRRYRSSMD